ncbi:MAG: hypothetical protein RRC34_10395 [Lentisphaeria bacterium]|nr:hypothetical protein [Lentisphaeria bacterium]
MKKRDLIGLLMATELEAEPLISEHGFAAAGEHPFPTYSHGDVVLVLSGIGKANAAAAAAWLITTFAPRRVINAGAAGATGHDTDLGDIFQIDTVFEFDRPRLRGEGVETFSPSLIAGPPALRLATQDHTVTSAEERRWVSQFAELVDMEGAAVAGTCDRFGVPAVLIKFVSDTHDGHSIADNIIWLRDTFCDQLYHWLRNPGSTWE